MIIKADKNKVLKEFQEKYLQDSYKDNFDKIVKSYDADKESIKEKLASAFNMVCKEAISLQEKNLKGEIMYIYFSMLRTKLLENKGHWRVDLYDEKWFLDKEECMIDIDFGFIYEPLFTHMEELSEKKKEYLRVIKEKDLEAIKLKEANKYHGIALNIIKAELKNFLESPSYIEMKKKKEIFIMAGEYMDSAIQINFEN
ncbi:hypothetical protein [Clostridium saccharoperbutylacetonicum]